jgi:DNA topoisomerase VI subunit B
MCAHVRVCISGRLGDGSLPEDGIYVLLKEVIDNSIDEFKMKAGKRIEIDIEDNLRVTVRDYGRGIPQGKLIEAVSRAQYRRQIRFKSIQEKCRTQWSGHQSG